MDITASARNEWQTCRSKAHCAHGARHVTGADLVRISRTLALEPWHFTETTPAAPDDPTGIAVDGGERLVNVELRKAPHGCVFLIRTDSGAGRCGIGDLAPVACRVFPAQPDEDDGSPTGRAPGCACQEWSPEDLDGEALARARREWAADRVHWLEVVARWQDFVSDGPGAGLALGAEDFHRYLLEAQGAREAGAPWPEEVA